ncbi:hypothetical protein H4R20_006435, partial [Coemansia guatemalensis]
MRANHGKDIFANEIVKDIIKRALPDPVSKRLNLKAGSESNYQNIINSLMKQIEETLQYNRVQSGIRWIDTHDSRMPDGSKPDGILVLDAGHTGQDWKWTGVVFELKSDAVGSGDIALRGQLSSYLVSMLQAQPRRHLIGVSISKGGEMYLYVCLPSKICYHRIGALPCYDDRYSEQAISAVRFLLLLYLEVAKDPGFITTRRLGIFSGFSLQDVVNAHPVTDADIASAVINIQGYSCFSGCHSQLVGPQSWLYRDVGNQIVKFHWCSPKSSEILIHQKALELQIPHIPEILHSVIISHPYDSLNGELLVLDDAGTTIEDVLLNRRVPDYAVVDIFAGYFHTILAASSVCDGEVILHRDISAGNLLVRDSMPFVIDWGLGLYAHAKSRVVSTTPLVGTAPFMGVRVLCSMERRSCIDDIESLLLVLS